MFNYNKLRGRIREVFETQGKFAKAIGKSETSVSKRLNNEIPFDQIDIQKSIEVLNIPVTEIKDYFFNPKV